MIIDTDARITNRAIPVLLCRVGDLHCAIPGARVTEVMRVLTIDPVPGMLPFILGLSIIRGMPVPVVDIGSLLGAPDSRGRYFVSVDAGGLPVALTVDEIPGFLRIPQDVLAPLPPLLRDAANGAVAALRARDGQLLILLDTARLVSAQLFVELNQAGATP